MGYHVIRRGDHLARIAHAHGTDADTIWNHSENRELRDNRESRDVLAEGDTVYIPDAPPPAHHNLVIGTTNRFRARVPGVPIQIVVRGGGDVLRNEPCVVEGLGDPLEQSTDGDGVLQVDVPVHLAEVVIRLPQQHFSFAARVAHLEPVDQERGVFDRLVNLGYLLPLETFGGSAQIHGGMFRGDQRERYVSLALRAFQAKRGLEQTGIADDATRSALRDEHGS